MRHRSARQAALALVAVSLATAACDTGDGRTLDPPIFPPPEITTTTTAVPEPSVPAPLRLVAPWPDGAAIPVRHTCDDEDLSPALSWSSPPVDAIELALTVVDIDAAGFVHWIAFAIPPAETGVQEGLLPATALEWPNDFGRPGWGGPCPPTGETHRYRFTVHALNQQLEVADDATAMEVISILDQITIEQASVTGTYTRAG